MNNKQTASHERTGVGSRATKLLISTWSLLQSIERRKLDQKTVCQYRGITEASFSNWTAGSTELSQIEALLRLLERVPLAARAEFLGSFLRLCPTLDSPALSHDPLAIHGLRSLLDEKQGLTFIQGPRDFFRSCVLNAIGYSANQIGSALRPIAGLDLHPETFVPVHGVSYVGHQADQTEIQHLLRAIRQSTQTGDLILINCLWCGFPDFQQHLIACAETRHIVIADDAHFDPKSLRRILGPKIPGRILSVSELAGDRIGIHFAQV